MSVLCVELPRQRKKLTFLSLGLITNVRKRIKHTHKQRRKELNLFIFRTIVAVSFRTKNTSFLSTLSAVIVKKEE